MKLSVIIVNYNVKYFLEQCLLSVFKASQGIEMEVYVVDNNSVDGSVATIRERFPQVKLIENKENLGFSKANNQAAKLATGEYILLLNPDTIVEENTFRTTLAFMDEHTDGGGLGVKMVDGKGKFLPESKRGLPTPATAFYKVFGLARVFPRSKVFGKYHLGFLDQEKIHEVDILSGAFMMLRKSVLDKTGLLDEDFFMYGEDIDLSYRITKAGFKNFYFPETRIIHYKGESTKKGSLNYVFVFYNAMIIFARKHFSKQNARLFSFLINIAVYLRAFMAIISRFIKTAFVPFLDAVLIFGGIFFIKGYWENQVIFRSGGEFPLAFIAVAVPIYIFIWLFSVYISGGYDKPYRLTRIIRGLFWGTVIILTGYALLNEAYRFSRALIILGAVWAMVSMLGTRSLLHLTGIRAFRLDTKTNRRFIVVGDYEESQRVAELLRSTEVNAGFIGLVGINETRETSTSFIGALNQLDDIITIYKIDEVVFCSKSLSPQVIIDKMTEFQYNNVEFKIAPPESLSIIGSNSINTSGDLYVLNLNSINRPGNKRSKLLFDITVCLALIAILPIDIFIVKRPHYLFRNIIQVLFRVKSWVGYHPSPESEKHLPAIKRGVLNPTDSIKIKPLSIEIIERLNILYAKDYRVTTDLAILWKGFRQLGRK
jgi:O-antigen biosynthesis protein